MEKPESFGGENKWTGRDEEDALGQERESKSREINMFGIQRPERENSYRQHQRCQQTKEL